MITQEFVDAHMNAIKSKELSSFVKVRSKRAIRGGRITFFDVPKTKEKLIKRFLELRSEQVVDPLFDSVPSLPVLLESLDESFDV